MLATAFLITSSAKRLRKMRKVVERALSTNGAHPITPELKADHEMVLEALERAERKAWKRQAK